jgi:hypothetical protein
MYFSDVGPALRCKLKPSRLTKLTRNTKNEIQALSNGFLPFVCPRYFSLRSSGTDDEAGTHDEERHDDEKENHGEKTHYGKAFAN